MIPTQTLLRRPDSAVDLIRVGWHRSWSFTPLLRRDTRARAQAADRSWTWQWIVVAWQAVCLLPWLLPAVGSAARHIWMIDGASAQVKPLRTGRPTRRPRGVALVCTAAFSSNVAILVVAMSAATLLDGLAWRVVFVLWVLPITMLLLRNAADAVARWMRGGRPGLGSRLAQLAGDRPGYVLAEVAAPRGGAGRGRLLLHELQNRWDEEDAVGILRTGSGDLVDYYRDTVGGWVPVDSTDRSMAYGVGGEHR